jgi:hypothetical protein
MIFETILTIVILAVFGYGIYHLMHKKLRDNKEIEIIEMLRQYGRLVSTGKTHYFEFKGETVKIVFFHVPAQAELTINSKTIWEVKYYQTTRLINQSKLTETTQDTWVIVYPSVQPIKRYINENEMVFVKPEDTFYHLRVIPVERLESFIIDQL